ncbi:MAG: TetR/AcrR family transcriptional regulator [Clostridiales Family XIII bacterium]|nr:TetR/AcrR family transcriptional regulator [Clostridiales Family XIII bacterium]
MSGKEHKNDIRARYTRRVLRDCLLLLLEKKPLRRITVRELCEAAAVNRATFYAHYTDIFDLMEQLTDGLRAEIIDHVRAHMLESDENKRPSLVKFLRLLRENAFLYLLLARDTEPGGMSAQLWLQTRALYLGRERLNGGPPPLPDLHLRFVLIHAVHGSCAALNAWLQADAPIPEDALADLIVSNTHPLLR